MFSIFKSESGTLERKSLESISEEEIKQCPAAFKLPAGISPLPPPLPSSLPDMEPKDTTPSTEEQLDDNRRVLVPSLIKDLLAFSDSVNNLLEILSLTPNEDLQPFIDDVRHTMYDLFGDDEEEDDDEDEPILLKRENTSPPIVPPAIPATPVTAPVDATGLRQRRPHFMSPVVESPPLPSKLGFKKAYPIQ